MNKPRPSAVIQAAGLHKRFNEGGLDVQVLQGVDLQVARGEFASDEEVAAIFAKYRL